MDHRWDDSTSHDRGAREERERFAASRIERDLDVERRDRLLEEERTRPINMSPWAIGMAFYDQRDRYTQSDSIDEDGYGLGPSYHPEEGSYAYHREFHPGFVVLREGDANLFEREAWPWLNYKSPHEDPYFAHLHDHEEPHGFRHRLGNFALALKGRLTRAFKMASRQKGVERPDESIKRDVTRALRYCRDLDASDIEVGVRDAKVKLDGTVTSRREKRMAREVSERVSGVRDVRNKLKIRHDPSDANLSFALPLA